MLTTHIILRNLLIVFLSVVLAFNPLLFEVANANPVDHIVVDGSTETTIDRAQNNTPVVNIARPNSSGLSHNSFRDYNVLSDNAIINNFKGDVAVSKLGGALYGNPNFNKSGGRTAKIILNEITSNRITKLQGYTEIFGDRASLIIANPNGIQTSGAGFINTSRLSLITGRPNINSDTGSIEDFDIDPKGEITITARNVNGSDYLGKSVIIPLGLDASTSNYSEIISRTIKISGEIYGGGDLNIKSGNSKYNYSSKEVSSIDKKQDNIPEFAIDGKAFGSMYAGKITFKSTEAGLGVRSASGNLMSTVDDININADGDVEFVNLTSNNNINITSNSGKITQNNSAYAKNNIDLEANQEINIKGSSINSEGDIIITSNNSNVNIGDITLLDDKFILDSKNLKIDASSEVNIQNSQFIINHYYDQDSKLKTYENALNKIEIINATDLSILNSKLLTNVVNFDVDNQLSIDDSTIFGSESITKKANYINSSNTVLNSDLINLYSHQVIYDSSKIVSNKSNINLTTDILKNINHSLIISKKDINIFAQNILNQGNISADNDINITFKKYLTNDNSIDILLSNDAIDSDETQSYGLILAQNGTVEFQ